MDCEQTYDCLLMTVLNSGYVFVSHANDMLAIVAGYDSCNFGSGDVFYERLRAEIVCSND